MPANFAVPVSFDPVYGFYGKGQTYHSAMLTSNIYIMEQRIKGNNRMSLDKWTAGNEVDLKDAFDRCDTKKMYVIVKKVYPKFRFNLMLGLNC